MSCDNTAGGVPPAHQADLHFQWVLVIRGMEIDVHVPLNRTPPREQCATNRTCVF